MFATLASFPGIGLLLAHVLSFAVALPSAVRQFLRINVSTREIGRVMYERREFPLLSLPGAVLDVIGYSVCVWIMIYYFGMHEAGQYSQIQRIVGAPLMLLGMSVSQVLLCASTDVIGDRNSMIMLFRQLLVIVGVLGLVVVTFVVLVGDTLLHWLIGSQWRVDAEFIVPITIAATVRACVSPLSALLITLRMFRLGTALAAHLLCFFCLGADNSSYQP